MQIRYSSKPASASDNLKSYTDAKLRKLIEKFTAKSIEAHITFSCDRHMQNVHCSLSGGDGFNIQVESTSEDMRTSIDGMLDKLQTQLRRKKEKIKDHKSKKGIKALSSERAESEDAESKNTEE